MIQVIATIELAPAAREQFLKIFQALVPKVRQEAGCLEYGPMADVPTGIPVQMPLRPNVVTIVEKWADIAALKTHLAAPHMLTYRQEVQDLVVGLQLQVLAPI